MLSHDRLTALILVFYITSVFSAPDDQYEFKVAAQNEPQAIELAKAQLSSILSSKVQQEIFTQSHRADNRVLQETRSKVHSQSMELYLPSPAHIEEVKGNKIAGTMYQVTFARHQIINSLVSERDMMAAHLLSTLESFQSKPFSCALWESNEIDKLKRLKMIEQILKVEFNQSTHNKVFNLLIDCTKSRSAKIKLTQNFHLVDQAYLELLNRWQVKRTTSSNHQISLDVTQENFTRFNQHAVKFLGVISIFENNQQLMVKHFEQVGYSPLSVDKARTMAEKKTANYLINEFKTLMAPNYE